MSASSPFRTDGDKSQKLCNLCKETLPVTDFFQRGDGTGPIFACKPCYRSSRRERYHALDGVCKATKLRRWRLNQYGITQADYDRMLAGQDGHCAICPAVSANASDTRPLHVDHCHRTGKVRGLLCQRCNMGLGAFDDDPEKMTNAVEYLVKHV